MDVGKGREQERKLEGQSKSIPLIPAFIHMDVMYASNAGAFTCLPQGREGETTFLLSLRLRHLLDVQVVLAIGNFDLLLDETFVDLTV